MTKFRKNSRFELMLSESVTLCITSNLYEMELHVLEQYQKPLAMFSVRQVKNVLDDHYGQFLEVDELFDFLWGFELFKELSEEILLDLDVAAVILGQQPCVLLTSQKFRCFAN